ncbi:glutathione-dependent formaldehyde-activating enzyme [Zopfia rhizophila CBS 207.26]|uniref:Glutathione-dependent formaldehyde-activating enzyme n=1 Tax=Zopfia rhizophila CBS 207.26 TaxID=1314779 RepID=A0A6A6ED36_9PEZI|nr:glutathione-dependent formaldehyde-activating enzyme [Zopfia rhizophila CBS 207.26]
MSSGNTPESSKPSQTYTASCHCGRFKYHVTHSPPLSDPEASVTNCNCSICSRNGYLLIYVPESFVQFEKGSHDELTKYTFGPKHKIAHYFCPSCGTSCFAQSTDPNFYGDMKVVNVRTFHDLDLKSLTLKEVDGKNF